MHVAPCSNCGSSDLRVTTTDAVGHFRPDLLPGASGVFHLAKFDVCRLLQLRTYALLRPSRGRRQACEVSAVGEAIAQPHCGPLHQEPARARAGSQSQEAPLTSIGA